MKDAGLRIRVQRELRERFVQACGSRDRSAAQVLREFMRAYVAVHEAQFPEIAGPQADPSVPRVEP